MSQQELLRRVVTVLDRLSLDYMLTGSLASSIHGAPRLTHDIDLVLALEENRSEEFFDAFDPSEFYLSRAAMGEALATCRMFNLLEYREGDKVDFWILTDEPFDQSRFRRKQSLEIPGMRIKVSTPEDTILAKLRWALLSGGSQKQLDDARSIHELQVGSLDVAYIETWARSLGVVDLWRLIQSDGNLA